MCLYAQNLLKKFAPLLLVDPAQQQKELHDQWHQGGGQVGARTLGCIFTICHTLQRLGELTFNNCHY